MSVEIEQSKLEGDSTQYFKFEIEGVSFLYHMIRKMVGSLIQIYSQKREDNFHKKLFERSRLHIWLAPAEGLFLDDIEFDLYHKHYPDRDKMMLTQEQLQKKEEFKNEQILPEVFKAEFNDCIFSDWYEKEMYYYDKRMDENENEII